MEQYNALKLHQRNEKTDMPEHKSESSVQEIQSHIDLVEKSSDDSEQESEQYEENYPEGGLIDYPILFRSFTRYNGK